MADNLVIVESPAKAKTISKFLGKDFKVQASMGHVRDLPKTQFGVDIENNFKPKYITIRGKGKVLKKLRRAVKKSNEVYLATDPDREGEAISWHLAYALKLDRDDKLRIEFNEITKRAVREALKGPRQIDRKRVNAQKARRILDRVVGYKLSPLLWRKVRKGLSAGRVQSVAVRLICDREVEIRNFEPEEYWTMSALLSGEEGELTADLKKKSGKKVDLSSKEEVDQVLAELDGAEFKVAEVKKRKRRRHPSPPFTTSTLQQRASHDLRFTTKKTMYIAQQLYEGVSIKGEGSVGLITYIRTDSTRISSEAEGASRQFITDRFGDKFYPEKARTYKTSRSAQEAHEAIRPTDVNRLPAEIKDDLTSDQYKLYRLIWERFVASRMTSAVLDTLTVNIAAGDYIFRANGSKLVFPGFMVVDKSRLEQEKDKELPLVKEGEKLALKKLDPEQHFTKPPARYSEATLVKDLEKKGIGRPSTYSVIVSTIQQRGYVIKENKRFQPTELGEKVNELLTSHFPDITNTEFTANLEDRLDKIEEGEESWEQVLSSFYSQFAHRLGEAEENMEEVELEEEVTDEICEKCGKNLVVKHGRYGKFLACPGFPDCRFTKPLLKKVGVSCPECKDGDVVERRSKKGRKFYGCSEYPDCEFMSWNQPVEKKCPECEGLMVLKRRKNSEYRQCIDKECGYQEKT